MGSDPNNNEWIIDANGLETYDDDNLQKPNIYNKSLPFYETIKQQGLEFFDEIRENLSRTIQLGELEPGFSFWSNKLERFISFYGFHFTKIDHLKLIHFYLSILSINDLSCSSANICFELLYDLVRFVFFSAQFRKTTTLMIIVFRKSNLITRDDLTIDWRHFYRWAKLIYNNNHDKTYGLITLPKFVVFTFNN
jgi:hypothetical protein